MHRPKFPLLPTLVLLILISFAAANKEEESPCKPWKCGGVHNISYPFWLPGEPSRQCDGHPDFELVCRDDHLFLANPYPRFPNSPKYVNHSDPCFWLISIEFITSQFEGNDCQIDLHANISQVNKKLILQDCPSGPYKESNDVFRTCLIHNAYFAPDHYRSSWERLPAAANVCRILLTIPISPNYDEHDKNHGEPLNGMFLADWSDDRDVGNCSACTDCGEKCRYDRLLAGSFFCPCEDGQLLENCDDTPNQDPPPETHDTQEDHRKQIVTGSIAGAMSFLLTSAVLFICVQKGSPSTMVFRNKSKCTQNIEAFLNGYGSMFPRRYKYSDLKKITKSFREKLGQGGFGSVFKGALPDGQLVAVKILSSTTENGEEFINEVAGIGRTSHVNIVGLLGFCIEGSKRALVYQFMPNGSLEKYIYSDQPKLSLPWEKLHQIAIGTARGLEYLHLRCNTRIVHFDIKPHNILLDEDFCPKISDFGLAKLCTRQEGSQISMGVARGTIGYIAPEVFSRSFGVVSTKSDVYSYGMMVLEMVGGRRNVKVCADRSSEVYFPHWVYEHLDTGLGVCDVTAETDEIARKMILVGLWCIQTMPISRPSISRVVEMLEGRACDIQLPPKPSLSSA